MDLCKCSSLNNRYAYNLVGSDAIKLTLILQDSYIQQRSTAIESIETTIAELGQIFTQLANMVAEQRETVQRIDADTHDIMSNVSGAQRELLKYYASISSNRWLMLKIFGVLIVFVSFRCIIITQYFDQFFSSWFSFSYHDPVLDELHAFLLLSIFMGHSYRTRQLIKYPYLTLLETVHIHEQDRNTY